MKNSNMYVSLHSVPFSRRGSFFTFMLAPLAEEDFGMTELYLSSCRAGANGKQNRLVGLHIMHGNTEVPYALSSTKSELIMDSDYGQITFCIAEPKLILVRAIGDVWLRCTCAFNQDTHEMAKPIKGGKAVLLEFSGLPGLVFKPVNGEIRLDAPWNWRDTSSYSATVDILPTSGGKLLLAVEEFLYVDGTIRPEYPGYDASVKAVEEDFADFMKIVPIVTDKVCLEMYERAAWTSWAHLIGPSGFLKREMMAMMLYYINMCASWQQSYQAITFSRSTERSWEFLMSMFDYQQEDGHVPAFMMDTFGVFGSQQSPFQGFAVCWLLEHAEMKNVPASELKKLYGHILRLTNWWLEHRIDEDGLPMYLGPDESGWDDSTVYIDGCAMKTPDLCTYFAFLFEALARLAVLIGGMEREAEEYSERSKGYIDLLLTEFWDGQHFLAISPNGRKFRTDNICLYQPLMLGKRLPEDVIETVTADLMREGHFLTPHGFASEDITSPYVDPYKGWMCGPVIAPVQFMINIGLEECGKIEYAREAARRFCYNLVNKKTLLHIINPFDGTPQLKGRDGVQRQPWTSWCSAVFLFLSSRYCSE